VHMPWGESVSSMPIHMPDILLPRHAIWVL
jgi:hypothetical protein